MFSQSAAESLGCYVYGLFAPDNPTIPFYIGKGRGNRIFDHVKGSLDSPRDDDLMPLKIETIKKIGPSRVIHKILRFNLSNDEALKIEATLIDLVNHMMPGQLTNLVSGHGTAEGIYDTRDLAVALNADPLKTDEPVLLIKIERKWGELTSNGRGAVTITRNEIYEAVKGDWVLSINRAKRASCVLAVARGLVRATFVPLDWEAAGYENRKRMTQDGGDGGFSAFVGQSVAHLASAGSQNPVRYINC